MIVKEMPEAPFVLKVSTRSVWSTERLIIDLLFAGGLSFVDQILGWLADHLRFAVMDAICRSDKRRASYVEALIAITVEESLKRYDI